MWKILSFKLFIKELISSGINQENIILINFDSAKYNNINKYSALDELVLNLTENIKGKVISIFWWNTKCQILGKKYRFLLCGFRLRYLYYRF